MALQSFRRLRPNWAMSVSVLAPAKIAVTANVSIAANECRVPRGSRGSDSPKNISYNDGTDAVVESALIILNLLEVENRHFPYENLEELKSPERGVTTASVFAI
jgi:hypothetical protein